MGPSLYSDRHHSRRGCRGNGRRGGLMQFFACHFGCSRYGGVNHECRSTSFPFRSLQFTGEKYVENRRMVLSVHQSSCRVSHSVSDNASRSRSAGDMDESGSCLTYFACCIHCLGRQVHSRYVIGTRRFRIQQARASRDCEISGNAGIYNSRHGTQRMTQREQKTHGEAMPYSRAVTTAQQ